VSATVDESKGSRDVEATDVLLAGSIAANAGFAAIHVRRHLARVRRHKFSIAENATEEQTTDPTRGCVSSPDWSVVVRVLGPPMVTKSDGQRISFDKGKALELLVWMSEHRDVSTRSAARAALWDGAVKDATFSNVVSEVRRSLNSGHPDRLEDWIPRTFTDDLPLHRGVVTDAQLLDVATKNFERDRDRFAAELVRHLIDVRNLPFSGADYGWADGEGITTSHVIKVVRAAVLVGEYAIEQGDDELLFMATERGLRVLPGHEQLVSLRMRGHARSGNRAAIKFEWESYARSIEADSWAGAEPSRELEELARELSRGVV
jgi:two-component SAPR family response regulator